MFLLKLSGEGAPGRTIEMMKSLDFAPVQAVSLETTLEVTLWPNINFGFCSLPVFGLWFVNSLKLIW